MKTKTMRKIIYLLFLMGILNLDAQTQNFSVDMFPKSADAAASSKFVDIPSGNYTGVADFSIPLYTIEFEGQKIPIELRYTTTGVKVGEVASKVGLGWSLNTGPSMSQQVIGVRDTRFPKYLIPLGFAPNIQASGGNPIIDMALDLSGTTNSYNLTDVKPDIFSYSLLNSSGKYILDREGKFGIPMPYNQIKISTFNDYYGINVVDEEGFRYRFYDSFGLYETTNTCGFSTILEAKVNDSTINKAGSSFTPDFKITKLISPKNEEVNYIYDDNPIKYLSTYTSSIVTRQRAWIDVFRSSTGIIPQAPAFGRPKCVNYVNSKVTPLKEIRFPEGKVILTYNDLDIDPREDIKGGLKLLGVTVRNNNGQVIKDYTLNYDYFRKSPNEITPNLTNIITDAKYLYGLDKRLKLTSVKDNLTNGVYRLEYYESYNNKTLPSRVSNDQDYWGVYNGKNNGDNSIPSSALNGVPNVKPNLKYIGADKSPDINFGRLGNLKKITYPTGGYTTVEYEADDFDYTGTETVYSYETVETPYMAYDYNYIPINTEIEVPENSTQELLFTGNPNVGSTTTIGKCRWNFKKKGTANTESGEILIDGSRNDPAGTYQLWVTQDELFPTIRCDATYTVYETTITPVNVITINGKKLGTIRVNKIESFDDNNGKTIRQFTYKQPIINDLGQELSSGKNFGEEFFIARSTLRYPVDGEGSYATETQISDNPGWQTTTVRGKSVGYEYVQEHYINENEPSKSYTKEYKFNNENHGYGSYYDPNSSTNVSWPVDGLNRGLLLEERLFNSNKDIVKETFKEYTFDGHFNSKYSNSAIGADSMGSGIEILLLRKWTPNWGPQWRYEFVYNTFPLKNTWITDTLTITKEYILPTKFIETKQRKKYSVPQYSHTYPVESYTELSTGDELKTTYKYIQNTLASEIGPAQQSIVLDSLIAKNRISNPIIAKSYKNNLVLSEQKTVYEKFVSNGFILPKYIYQKNGQDATAIDNKITYDLYDNKGNLTQYTLENGISTAIIWGYNQTQPIAKVEGATYSQVSSLASAIISASNDDANDTVVDNPKEQSLVDALDGFRTNSALSGYQVTTYTYDPLIGVRSITPPSGIRETYIYDTANRLKEVRDVNGNLLKSNEYHYKP